MRYGLNMAVHAVSVEERLAAHRADLVHRQAVRARQLADGTAPRMTPWQEVQDHQQAGDGAGQ